MKQTVIILLGVIWVLTLASSCKRGQIDRDSGRLAFYQDAIDLEEWVDPEDPPNRRASMRMVARAWRHPEEMDLVSEIESALRLDPYNPYAYYFLSLTHYRRGELRKTELMAKRAEQLFQDQPDWRSKALVLQAKALVGQNKKDQALAAYQKAEMIDPENPLIAQGFREIEALERR